MLINYEIGDKFTCEVCNKEFIVTINHRYILNGQPTCSWKCFTKRVKENEKKKKLEAALKEKERLEKEKLNNK